MSLESSFADGIQEESSSSRPEMTSKVKQPLWEEPERKERTAGRQAPEP